MDKNDPTTPEPHQVQRDAARVASDEHYHGGSTLDGMTARISADVTAAAQRRRKIAPETVAQILGASHMVCLQCNQPFLSGCEYGTMADGSACPNSISR